MFAVEKARQLVSAVDSALRVLGSAAGGGAPPRLAIATGDGAHGDDVREHGAIGAAAEVPRTLEAIEQGILDANRRNELRRREAERAAAEGRSASASWLRTSTMEPNVALVPSFVANALRNAVRAAPLPGSVLRERFAEHGAYVLSPGTVCVCVCVAHCWRAGAEASRAHRRRPALPFCLPPSPSPRPPPRSRRCKLHSRRD